MAQLLPFMPVIAGETRMQPVYVGDVADAVMAGLTGLDTAGQDLRAGRPAGLDVPRDPRLHPARDPAQAAAGQHPDGLARFQASIAEKLPTKPFTRDQLLLLSRDNVVSPGMPGLSDLGIAATPVELIVPEYLDRYRPGGGKLERVPT